LSSSTAGYVQQPCCCENSSFIDNVSIATTTATTFFIIIIVTIIQRRSLWKQIDGIGSLTKKIEDPDDAIIDAQVVVVVGVEFLPFVVVVECTFYWICTSVRCGMHQKRQPREIGHTQGVGRKIDFIYV
jgi:hypothetical protein